MAMDLELGTIFLGDPGHGIHVFNTDNFKMNKDIAVASDNTKDLRIRHLAFTEETIVSGSDNGIHIFDRKSGEKIDVLTIAKRGKWVQAVGVCEIVAFLSRN
jgi:hypothetical protein